MGNPNTRLQPQQKRKEQPLHERNLIIADDAIRALIGLGISKQDASSKVHSALLISPSMSVDELIRQALKK